MADQQLKGAVLEFFGASLAIVGLNAQKWAADGDKKDDGPKKADDGGGGGGGGRCCGWRWALAISLFVAGQVIQTAAFAFGSQSLVAAMSNLSLVTNAVVAHFWFHEPFHLAPRPAATRGPGLLPLFIGWDLGAVALVVAGTVVTGLFSTPPPPGDPTIGQLRLLFSAPPYLCCLALSLAAALLPLRWLRSEAGRVELVTLPRRCGSLYALSAASFAAVSITLSKVSVLLLKRTAQGQNQFTDGAAFAFVAGFVVLAVVNLRVLNEGLSKFDASFVIPVYYVSSTLLTIVSGELLYGTYVQLWRQLWPKGLAFAAGLALSLFGVHVMATPVPQDVDDVGDRGGGGDGEDEDEDEDKDEDEDEDEEVGLLGGVQRSAAQEAAAATAAHGDRVQAATAPAPAAKKPRALRSRTLGSSSDAARGGGSGARRRPARPMLRRLSSGIALGGAGQPLLEFAYPTRMHRTGSMDMFAAVALVRTQQQQQQQPPPLPPPLQQQRIYSAPAVGGSSSSSRARAQTAAAAPSVGIEMGAVGQYS